MNTSLKEPLNRLLRDDDRTNLQPVIDKMWETIPAMMENTGSKCSTSFCLLCCKKFIFRGSNIISWLL